MFWLKAFGAAWSLLQLKWETLTVKIIWISVGYRYEYRTTGTTICGNLVCRRHSGGTLWTYGKWCGSIQWRGSGSGQIGIILADMDPCTFQPNVKGTDTLNIILLLENFNILLKILQIMTLMRKIKQCKLARLGLEVQNKFDFRRCVKLGAWSGSGSASK